MNRRLFLASLFGSITARAFPVPLDFGWAISAENTHYYLGRIERFSCAHCGATFELDHIPTPAEFEFALHPKCPDDFPQSDVLRDCPTPPDGWSVCPT